jgi:hypothetical protein
LYTTSGIIRMTKLKRMGWARHNAHMGEGEGERKSTQSFGKKILRTETTRKI